MGNKKSLNELRNNYKKGCKDLSLKILDKKGKHYYTKNNYIEILNSKTVSGKSLFLDGKEIMTCNKWITIYEFLKKEYESDDK